ncbi:VOC family protein [Nocardia sp. CA-290969]|uniref:VOC family protein n=1 Tax=Nocardia sp. CA-290969 TaxID=3239986 RepID=UPI003D901D55
MPYINHVALPVDDVDRASAFYVDWFGARVVPSPKFPVPVAWLLLGPTQIHLVQHPDQLSTNYHFAVSVEDRGEFEALYRRAESEDRLDRETFPNHIFELPNGNVQMWMRDHAGNVIEVDYPDITDLDSTIAAVAGRWVPDSELSAWNRQSSLFMPEQAILSDRSDVR